MHPRHIHYFCDFCLLLPFIGIFISVYFTMNALDIDMQTIHSIFETWKMQPIHILQQSHDKTCHEMGMYDIIKYEWPGTVIGCLCNNGTKLHSKKCTLNHHKKKCNNVDSLRPYVSFKWKDQYICAMTTIKNTKGYLDFVRIKDNDFCAYKTKKCGIIDTLNNYLCIPEGDNCPINDINIISNEDKSFELTVSNRNVNNGKIYVSFLLGENKLCLNHKQTDYQAEKAYPLFDKKLEKYMTCSTFSANKTTIDKDTLYRKFDSYSKATFYKQNGIKNHIRHLPLYPEIKSTIGLYGGVYTGWKKECETKTFYQFMNNKTNSNDQINDIISITNEYKYYFYLLTGIITLVFCIGIFDLKYRLILTASNKVEINTESFIFTSLIYTLISICCGIMIYYSHLSLKVIHKAEVANNFFEQVYNTNCSDEKTNFILKYIAEEFFSYGNKFFNIKMLSIYEIGFCLMIIFYTFFAKRNLDKKRAKKEKQTNYFNFE